MKLRYHFDDARVCSFQIIISVRLITFREMPCPIHSLPILNYGILPGPSCARIFIVYLNLSYSKTTRWHYRGIYEEVLKMLCLAKTSKMFSRNHFSSVHIPYRMNKMPIDSFWWKITGPEVTFSFLFLFWLSAFLQQLVMKKLFFFFLAICVKAM